jgi:hypothetical protein
MSRLSRVRSDLRAALDRHKRVNLRVVILGARARSASRSRGLVAASQFLMHSA